MRTRAVVVGRRAREAAAEAERRAEAGRAVDAEGAAHQADQAAADRQAEAVAAVLAAGAVVALREGVEDALLLLGRHADAGVAHGEFQRQVTGQARRAVAGGAGLVGPVGVAGP